MIRNCGVGLLLLGVTACQLPADRAPLQPLPEQGRVFTYDEILSRARLQAGVALEAFYVDNWAELIDAAQGLEQTARFLPKTTEQPPRLANKLAPEAKTLQQEALRLRDAAKTKDIDAANQAMQRIHLRIRQLRFETGSPLAPDPPKDLK